MGAVQKMEILSWDIFQLFGAGLSEIGSQVHGQEELFSTKQSNAYIADRANPASSKWVRMRTVHVTGCIFYRAGCSTKYLFCTSVSHDQISNHPTWTLWNSRCSLVHTCFSKNSHHGKRLTSQFSIQTTTCFGAMKILINKPFQFSIGICKNLITKAFQFSIQTTWKYGQTSSPNPFNSLSAYAKTSSLKPSNSRMLKVNNSLPGRI